MSRRRTHMKTGGEFERHGRMHPAVVCGSDNHMFGIHENSTDRLEHVTCGDCSKAIFGPKLAERGDTTVLEKDNDTGYRIAYRVIVEGEHRGWIVYDGAYGRANWKVLPIRLFDDNDERILPGKPFETKWTDDQGREHEEVPSFASKEQALWALPEYLGMGLLKTHVEKRQQRQDEANWLAKRRLQIAADDEAEYNRRMEALEGLRSIRDRAERGEIALTNFERDALIEAIVKVKPTKRGEAA